MTRDDRGSALVIAMLVLTVAQALVVAVTVRAILSAQAATQREQDARALNAAEAGLAEAVQRLLADNVAGRSEGQVGLARWEVEGEEELREPSVSVVTFNATSHSRDRTCRLRLRLVIHRNEELMIDGLRKLDWEKLP